MIKTVKRRLDQSARRLDGRVLEQGVGVFYSEIFTISTKGRETREITNQVIQAVRASGLDRGVCSVFVHHTSASLIVCENADPSVRDDLERFFERLVPDGDRLFRHTAEGSDDMPAHVRSILTQASVTIPVASGRPDLGTWQGVFLFEHRTHPHRRKITVSIVGESSASSPTGPATIR